ncbi:uncharacterized protein LOC127079917 [Lathyrus oleraceus]|uniref:uncharacterized protein LOC127079917 n=1 Tax=Pisum sativum TaxID=3888 RepID=UPI0021D388CD|nr:uncharacterized protein LOC127079917 [Pisum sativum]
MHDETNDDTYGDDFVIKCGIVSVFPVEYNMVSEVSETEEDFMPDETVGGKPLCYYIMNNGVVEEQKSMFERPSPGMMYYLKPLFIRAKVDGITVNKVFVDGGATVNLMPYTIFKKMGKCDDDLRQHNMVLSNYEGKTSNILGDFLGFLVHKKGTEINQNNIKAILDLKPLPTKKTPVFVGEDKLLEKIHIKYMTIGSMLAQEDVSGFGRPIYYLSQFLIDAETSWIRKWALALTKFSLTYKPLRAMMGQIVTDFIVDHAIVEPSLNMVDTNPWRLYFDAKYEALIVGLKILRDLGAKKIEVKGDSELVIRQITREYKCIKENLLMYFTVATQLLECFEVVSIAHVPRMENQEANEFAEIASRYKISKSRLNDIIEIQEKMVPNAPSSPNMAIPRIVGEGDADNSFNYDEGIDDECLENFAVHKVFSIENLSQSDWRRPIIEYLENPVRNTDRKIKYMALSYIRLGNELFKKTLEGILLKCLGNTEAYLSVSEVHSGACETHQAGHNMKWMLFRQCVYWPSMLKDCIEFAKGCQECQMHASVQHVPGIELHAIIKP